MKHSITLLLALLMLHFLSAWGWAGIIVLDLEKDFLSGNSWNVGGNWDFGTVPDNNDNTFVRHGGNVSILFNSVAGDLTVRDGSGVNSNDNNLTVSEKVTVESGPGGSDATLTIEPGGRCERRRENYLIQPV